MALSSNEMDRGNRVPILPEVKPLEAILVPGVPVSLGEPRPNNAGTPNYATLAGDTGSEPTPEEKREIAEVENYWGMGGILSADSFRYARKVLAYPNGDPSPVNREPLRIEFFSGVVLTDRQRSAYRALRIVSISRNGKEPPSDERLFADVIFPLTGTGKKRRKIRARFEGNYPSHIFQRSFRES